MYLTEILEWGATHTELLLSLCFILPILSGVVVWRSLSSRAMKRFKRLFDAYPGMLLVFGEDESILYMNPAAVQYCDRVKKMIDMSGIDYARDTQMLAEVFRTGRSSSFQYEVDGMAHRVFFAPLSRYFFGRRAVVAFIRENSELLEVKFERENYAAKLKHSKHRWDIVTNALPLHVFIKNPSHDYRYEFTNAAMQEFFGIDEASFLNKSDFELFPAEPARRYRAEDEENMLDMEHGFDSVVAVPDASGATRHLRLTRWPFVDEDGQHMLLGAALDVTELEQAKQEAEHSRQLLEALLRNLPVGVAAIELADSRFVLCNQAFCDIEDRNADEIIGQRYENLALSSFDFQPPDGDDKVERIANIRRPNGDEHFYRAAKFILEPSPGRRLLVCVFSDVTEITRNTDKLREQQELLEVIINSIPVMIFAKKAKDDYRYTLTNRCFEEFMGHESSAIIGHSDLDLFGDRAVADYFRQCDEKCIAAGKAVEILEEPLDASGRRRYLRTAKMPFPGADGEPLLLGVSVDITELNQMINNAEAVNQALAEVTLSESFDAAIGQVATALRRIMNCDRVMLSRCDEQGVLRLSREWKSDAMTAVLDSHPDLYYNFCDAYIEDMRAGEVLIFKNIADELSVKLKLDVDNRLTDRALIAAPIFIDGKLWGALFASYTARHAMGAPEEKLMRSMCSIIALAFMREQQNAALQRADRARQTTLDNIGIPIWLYGAKGELNQLNHSAQVLAGGLTVEEIRQKGCHNVFRCGLNSQGKCPVRMAIADGKPHREKYCNHGREYLFEARPVLDDDGHVLNVVQAAVDVTELNVMISGQQALTECLEALLSESDCERATDAAMALVCRHVGASRGALFKFDKLDQKTYCTAEYAVDGGESIFAAGSGYSFATRPDQLARSVEAGQFVLDDTFRNVDALGGDWPQILAKHDFASLCVNPVMIDGRLWGCVAFFYDHRKRQFDTETLTFIRSFAHFVELLLERSDAQTKIMQALEHAQAADKAKSFFIASVSHEIRTPLNAVIGFAELLRDGSFSPGESREYLDAIAYSGNALLQLINDVLDLSKLEAGQMHIVPEPVDFAELTQESLKVFGYSASQRGIELKSEMSDLPELELDKMRIRQIIFNLLGNAVKFTEHGMVTVSASFEPADAVCGEFTFAVTDTGIGISEEDQTKLMEPFVQLSRLRGTNASNNGTGLGLSISRRLVEKMGGTISIDSQPGQGSTFRVQIPGVAFHAARRRRPGMAGRAGDQKLNLVTSVLIVDDVEMNLKVMQAMCSRAGVKNIVTVNSGQAALKTLEEQSFSLMLTDMWMPVMDGAELARRVRADHRFDQMPVVAVTADAEAKENFKIKNFFAVLLKPVTIEKIKDIFALVEKNGGGK
ncbi:MAG: PAS domain-containing protein [Victivallaceae bacterium]|nr:PAS domain-containing protein [Victivallaceae bacterium]